MVLIDNGEGPLAVFFAQYPDFDYNRGNSATAEFYRLCDENGWERDDDEREVAREGFHNALTMQFNDNYGTDVNDLATWRALCSRLRMNPAPESLHACREVWKIVFFNQLHQIIQGFIHYFQAVRSKHVNLVDLVDNFDARKKVRIFPTVLALSEYTKLHGKFFPKENAHAGNLLKFLLRQIMNPELARIEGRRAQGQGNIHGRGRARGRGRRKRL